MRSRYPERAAWSAINLRLRLHQPQTVPDSLDEFPEALPAGWQGAPVMPVAFACVDRRV